MSLETKTKIVHALEKAKGELQTLSQTTTRQIESVARTFEGLAGHTDTILNLAAAMVGCVENESVSSILPQVQTLGGATRRFIGDRLQATTGILETVTTEVELLRQLSRITRGQEAIAFETKALSVLTNIEVARLGAVGAGFQYLAHELADFSKSVTADAMELAGHTDGRRAAIEETKQVLAAELPRLQEELARIELDLGNALSAVEFSLSQLSGTPMQFRTCVENVAQQIAGVVAAVQAHDITRQQIEHVQEAFALISAKMSGDENAEKEGTEEMGRAYAGLTIQIYQLRTIKETVANWASQIRMCMGGILKVSATDVAGIGPAVLDQERGLSSQLAHIERLESESQAYSERIQRTFGGIANLMQLVSEHLQKSKSVRDHLLLLTFNSIIEASHLGVQAAAILAIAQSIKGVSAEWGQITDQSGRAMQEVLSLAKHNNELMGAFSDVSNERLREAQAQTRAGLSNLRTAAALAAGQAQEMKAATDKLQAETTEVGNTVDLLDACFGQIDAMLTEIEGVRRQLEMDHSDVKERYDPAEVEQLFSAFYTTEMERDVLRAALRGTELPVAQQTFVGNSVELF
ncbi:MAG: hypothetical protein ABSG32_06060 [Terriglobia bacterium]|jgi:hypothetical protein